MKILSKMKMVVCVARKKYVSDFETTTKEDDCRVWAYGCMEIGNKKNIKIGTKIEDFMDWCKKEKCDIYFHNLKFDGSFIVNWLLHNGYTHSDDGLPMTFNTIISNMGQWYMIDICYGYKGKKKLHTKIYDSLKKLPFSVDVIGKAFNLGSNKVEVDPEFYTRERNKNHEITEEEYLYIYSDLEVMADALEIQFNQGLKAMTSGSDSLKGYKDVISTKTFEKLFPILSLEDNKEIRWCYRGGFTWLNERYANKDIGGGIVFDVNSLYPSQMYYQPLPFGKPIKFNGKYVEDKDYPLYTQHIRCEFILKEGYIPTIQLKNQGLMFKQNEYLKSSKGETVDLYLTNIDLKLIEEHYDLYDVEYVGGWKFRSKVGMFKEFIDKWMLVKATNKGAIRLLAKLMLNSLYGKFATNPKVTGKVPYLKEDGSNGFTLPKDENGNVVDEFKDPVYTPIGVFVTSYARNLTIRTAQKCYDRIIYCDTDSIHLEGTEIPDVIKDVIDDNKLGYWKHESTFQRARFIRQKTYIEEIDGKLHVICAGMPDRIKEKVTWENFHVGFSANGKMLPKQVKGGVVLEDTVFTLK